MAGHLNIMSENEDKALIEVRDRILERLDTYGKYTAVVVEATRITDLKSIPQAKRLKIETILLSSEYRDDQSNWNEKVLTFREYKYQGMKVDFEVHYDVFKREVLSIYLVM